MVKIIAEGSYGIIYQKSKTIAVKEVPCDKSSLKEIYLYQQLSHPHIFRLISTKLSKAMSLKYGADQVLHLEMPYIPRLTRNLGTAAEVSVARQLVDTIAYLHSRGIAHRDIHRKNILYDKDTGKAYLIDFGISSKLDSSRHNFALYMAPELYQASIDQTVIDLGKADVWSLGLALLDLIAIEGSTDDLSSKSYLTTYYAVKGKYGFGLQNTGMKYDESHPLLPVIQDMVVIDPTHRLSISEIIIKHFSSELHPYEPGNKIIFPVEFKRYEDDPNSVLRVAGITPSSIGLYAEAFQAKVQDRMMENPSLWWNILIRKCMDRHTHSIGREEKIFYIMCIYVDIIAPAIKMVTQHPVFVNAVINKYHELKSELSQSDIHKLESIIKLLQEE